MGGSGVSVPAKRPETIRKRVHRIQGRLARLWGRPSSGMRTDLMQGALPVIFLHNPKTGGNSMAKLLHVERLSHSLARDRLNEASWLGTFSVVVVRHPFQRFLSGYYSHILRPESNGLVKIYGWDIKKISPFDYLEVLEQNPLYGGPQTLWTDYPSNSKPRADLVLKLEEAGEWKARLVSAGVDVADRELPHLNPTGSTQSDHLNRLGLDAGKFAQLEARVRQNFDGDYRAFGYA
jgi:Sulfotransferase family